MTRFPKVSKSSFRLSNSEGLTSATVKAIANILVIGSVAIASGTSDAKMQGNPAIDSVQGTQVTALPAGGVMLLAPSLANDPMKMSAHESHYSHSSHSSHASHYSHYSSR